MSHIPVNAYMCTTQVIICFTQVTQVYSLHMYYMYKATCVYPTDVCNECVEELVVIHMYQIHV